MFVNRIDGAGTVRFHTALGVRELPHTSAAGKAIISWLPADEVQQIVQQTGLAKRTPHTISDLATLLHDLELTRARGYALDDEEDVEGVLCVAAPFFDHAGQSAGAVSVTGLKTDMAEARIEAVVSHLIEAASTITQRLGGRRPMGSAPD